MPTPDHRCPTCGAEWNGSARKCPNGHKLSPSEEKQLWRLDVRKEGSRLRLEISTARGMLMFQEAADASEARRFIRSPLNPRFSGKLGEEPDDGVNTEDAQRLGFERIEREGGASFILQARTFDELDIAFRTWQESVAK